MENKIIYFGDPLCSWCYGYAPEISKVKEHYVDLLDFELVMGGLRPYGTERMPELKSFLRHHWDEVYQRSGQPFRYNILDKDDFVYDTEPPSRAVLAVKELNPQNEFDFYKRVQKGFYYDNLNTNELETYLQLIEDFDLDPNQFTESYESDELRDKTKQSFNYSQQLGVRGFPTTVLQHGDKLYLVANGYAEAEVLIDRVEKLIKEPA